MSEQKTWRVVVWAVVSSKAQEEQGRVNYGHLSANPSVRRALPPAAAPWPRPRVEAFGFPAPH